MTIGRFVVFLLWTLAVMLVVGFLVFVSVYGDCAGDVACETASSPAPLILGVGFVIYWAVALLLFRRWSR